MKRCKECGCTDIETVFKANVTWDEASGRYAILYVYDQPDDETWGQCADCTSVNLVDEDVAEGSLS